RLLRPPGDSGAPDVHVVETSPAVASWIARSLGLVLFGIAAAAAVRASGPRAEWLAALGFLPLCMLLSPITWKGHHAALLPFFFGLAAFASDRARRPAWLVPLLVGYWVLCDLLSEELIGKELKNALQAVSLVAWADVVLIAVTLALVVRERAAPSDA
ncbi:MAG: hypothetical protein O7B99_14750, partial [Planctomycetota bacterium]|nr:hypothetical protein [Planctomycetota bacterium]